MRRVLFSALAFGDLEEGELEGAAEEDCEAGGSDDGDAEERTRWRRQIGGWIEDVTFQSNSVSVMHVHNIVAIRNRDGLNARSV